MSTPPLKVASPWMSALTASMSRWLLGSAGRQGRDARGKRKEVKQIGRNHEQLVDGTLIDNLKLIARRLLRAVHRGKIVIFSPYLYEGYDHLNSRGSARCLCTKALRDNRQH